jgi:hypothetical protein
MIVARVAYLLAALAFAFASWREDGVIVPLAGVAGAVVLVGLARRNARRRRSK